MPFVTLTASPHAANVSPVEIYYRDHGCGEPVVFLHGGWGYGAYPIDRQIDSLQDSVRFIIPDRSGHGRSTPFEGELPIDFHQRAAEETLLVLDALKLGRVTLWGHSDGAVIAAIIGLRAPQRCRRLILEALHLYKDKPSSRSVFFEKFADHPEDVSDRMRQRLIGDHGEEHWRNVVRRNCRVWLELATQSKSPAEDLYEGRLGELKVPTAFMHGRGDPRTEPGEIEQAHKLVKGSQMIFIEEGRHSPHSERASWEKCNEILRRLIAKE